MSSAALNLTAAKDKALIKRQRHGKGLAGFNHSMQLAGPGDCKKMLSAKQGYGPKAPLLGDGQEKGARMGVVNWVLFLIN